MPERHPGAVYGASKGKRPGSKLWYQRRVKYKATWSGGRWDEYVKAHMFGRVLQVCAGGSVVGDVRLDKYETPGMTVRGDMLALPFEDRSFDTVACDPPYGVKNPYRVRLQRELFRVARRRVIWKAPWLLRGRGWVLRKDLLTMIGSHTCASISALAVFDRDGKALFEDDE